MVPPPLSRALTPPPPVLLSRIRDDSYGLWIKGKTLRVFLCLTAPDKMCMAKKMRRDQAAHKRVYTGRGQNGKRVILNSRTVSKGPTNVTVFTQKPNSSPGPAQKSGSLHGSKMFVDAASVNGCEMT